MYSSYTAAQIARTYELADRYHVTLRGTVTWAFEFENQPYFAGFRDLATNGLDKPVLNVFRMLGQMAGERVPVESSSAATLDAIRDSGVRERPDIHALAARTDRSISVLVWNYHDDDLDAAPAEIEIVISGARDGDATLSHTRVDRDHSNAYEAWKKMGSPQAPTKAQYAQLEQAGKLQTLAPPRRVRVRNGSVIFGLSLPRQGVSLLKLVY
jgi:xylan 1,4-beta-xylosidase